MKAKVKVRVMKQGRLPELIDKGEWVDLCVAEETKIKAYDWTYVPLGVAMQLPAGYEAYIAPRSSTWKNFGIISCNSLGIIDNCYCGNNDEWKFPALAFRDTELHAGQRVCQFRITLSQKATMWQKIKWLFTSGIEFEQVDVLLSGDRGGFGSTGV